MMPRPSDHRTLAVDPTFSLAQTVGPVVWGRGGWPGTDWIDDALIWTGYEGDQVVWRRVRQDGASLAIDGSADAGGDLVWAQSMLGLDRTVPAIDDPAIAVLADRFAGLRPYTSGSLFEGLVTSIVGQSISVRAAAVTETRLSMLFHPGIEVSGRRFWPAPNATQLANAEPALIRTSGVTWRRAEAVVAVAREAVAGRLPTDAEAREDPSDVRRRLRELPLVGPWTAESTLVWGLGLDDAFPSGDVALLRAVKLAFGDDRVTLKQMDTMAEAWRPHRGWATRWLWAGLFGAAPE